MTRRWGLVLAAWITSTGLAFAAASPPDPVQARYEAQLHRLESHPPLSGPSARDTAIVNVHVLPMTTSRVLDDQVVLVSGGRITGLAGAQETRVPPGYRIIDGEGGYLIPGLADMHVHSAGNPLTLALFLANGVTTVREMSGRPAYLDWARRVASDDWLGPSIYTAGPIFGGRNADAETVVIADAGQAVREVDRQYEAGFRILKPYTFLPADAYRAALARAKARGMYVVGHIPYSVGTAGALAAGQDEIAHVHSFHPDFFEHFDPKRVFERYLIDPDFIPRMVPRIRAAGVRVTTTLIVNQALADSQDIERYTARPQQAYELSAGTALMRSGRWDYNKLWPHDYLENTYLPYLNRLIRALHEAGVPLVVGTDSGVPGLIHGFSTHEELALLVRAGLSPYDALRAATVNAALVSGDQAQWGTLEVGKRADVLWLGANPLEDIGHVDGIRGVMKAGRWLDRKAIDQMLAQVREAYQ